MSDNEGLNVQGSIEIRVPELEQKVRNLEESIRETQVENRRALRRLMADVKGLRAAVERDVPIPPGQQPGVSGD